MSTIKCPPIKDNHTVENISLPVMYTVTDLLPYTQYIVEVAAVNGHGEGHRINKTQMTEEEVPQKPSQITATDITAKTLTLSWNVPDPSPGRTTYTIFVYESTDDKGNKFTLNQTLKAIGFTNTSVKVSNLEEYWPYKFKINAATVKGNTTSDFSSISITSQAEPGQVVNLSVKMKGKDYRKAYVSWSLPPLREYNGFLKSYVFISNFTDSKTSEEPRLIDINLSQPSVEVNYSVNPGTVYYVKVALRNENDTDGKFSMQEYMAKSEPLPDEDFPLGIVVGVVGAVVAGAIIIGVVFLIRRRRNGLDSTNKYIEKIQNPTEMEDNVSKNIPRKRPIKLKELGDKVADKHKDSNLHFAREYDDLKAICAKHTTETSETDSNKLKNRYVNILPFDHSRVKLMLTEDDDPSTDFINANYLPGYRSPREYIATQGPIPGTIDDFWRMIWEQNVSIIVMLTLCKEEGRVKCEMYWPENTNEPKQYGDLVVETVSNSTVNFYDFRIFKIKLGDTTRSVKHFHFLQWKDFSANVQNDVMIDFIKNVRNHIRPPDMNGPVVVHCSAGVGRTGTYCALDHLFQFVDDNINDLDKSIDIFDLVMNLREQRMCMVQTEQQYMFIHDCVKDYLKEKRKEAVHIFVNQAFVHEEEDESLYQNYNNQRTDL
uniref:protein-tyrosine-phosphatase n=1 Tax=Crassostrea virginica TaxID=6565 RepID=A0A8B8AMA9_CRAVI|nr:receptor-type tyrosine-protein phosphatase beta-like isoform X2 [Crassostrea virginica]